MINSMFNEQANASMEIKQVDNEGKEICQNCEHCDEEFSNPYVESSEPQDIPSIPSVILYRSKEGIQRWMTRDDIGRLLAQNEGKECNEDFMKSHEKEIEEYFKRQPEGKDVKNVFQILEVGDSINHQTVTAVYDDHADLDYFGKKTSIYHEHEIFSILIHEEIEEWKNQISKVDPHKLFSKADDDMVTLFRSMELLCMNIDMESCDGLYLCDSSNLTQRLAGMMSASLKKPILDDSEDLKGKRVIAFSADYCDDNYTLEQCEVLYTVSLTNSKELEVRKGDRVVLC